MRDDLDDVSWAETGRIAETRQDVGEGTDFYAVRNGQVSVSPIKVDFTDHGALQPIESWLDKLE